MNCERCEWDFHIACGSPSCCWNSSSGTFSRLGEMNKDHRRLKLKVGMRKLEALVGAQGNRFQMWWKNIMVVSTLCSLHLSPFLFWKTFNTSPLQFVWSCGVGEIGWKPCLVDTSGLRDWYDEGGRKHGKNGEWFPIFIFCNCMGGGTIYSLDAECKKQNKQTKKQKTGLNKVLFVTNELCGSEKSWWQFAFPSTSWIKIISSLIL